MATKVQQGLQPINDVKKIIAVASGKGGVGKSTTAVNLALALKQSGWKIGLLDADIYGPNQPHMLGVVDAQPETRDENHLVPVEAHGLQMMSIGLLINQHTPMIWRGPMAGMALQQLAYDTLWNDLDCLIIDLPPGTGDIQLTMAQKVPVDGVVMVTTPQEVALLDVRKGIEMFQKVKVPVVGIIENMSGYQCTHCGHEEALFAQGGGEKLANEYQLPLLAQIPLVAAVRQQADAGVPIVIAQPDSAVAQRYIEAANYLRESLEKQPKNYARHFPRIVIENGE